MRKLMFLLLFLLLCATAQKAQWQWEEDIQSGNNILKAGETGNKKLIPSMRKKLNETRQFFRDRSGPLEGELTLALARLGEEESLREVYCKLHGKDYVMIGTLPYDLKYIGGWFSIKTSLELLDADERYRKMQRKNKYPVNAIDDTDPPPPARTVLTILPGMIPEAGIQFDWEHYGNQQKMALDAQRWKDYVAAHYAELRRLEPSTDPAEFEDCKKRKAK